MKVIITGGTGFIGTMLATELVSKGNQVIVLTRNPGKAHNLPAGVTSAAWDGKTAAGWGHLADGAGAIVNLAGESIGSSNLLKIRWSKQRKEEILASRINAGKAVVEAVQMVHTKPEVVVQISGVNYYGPQGTEPFDETMPAGNDFLANVCKEWEAATQPVEALGVRRVVLRMGVVLSKHGGTLPLQMIPFHFFVGGPIGNGKQGFSWVHVHDAIQAILFAIENRNLSGAFNLTGPVTVNNAQFSKALGRAMGRPSFFPLPGLFFKAAFGEAAILLLEGQKAEPKRLLDAGFKFRFNDPEAALINLLRK